MVSRWGVLAFALALAGGALGAEKPKPDAAAKKEEPVSADPQLTTATFGDWVERCQRLGANGEAQKACEVSATVSAQGQNTPLAELAIGRARKGAALRITLLLPVNVSFPSAPKLSAGDANPLTLEWRQCIPAGCFADAAFEGDFPRALREAKTAKVESKASNGAPFSFDISLRGLPQALDAMAKEP